MVRLLYRISMVPRVLGVDTQPQIRSIEGLASIRLCPDRTVRSNALVGLSRSRELGMN